MTLRELEHSVDQHMLARAVRDLSELLLQLLHVSDERFVRRRARLIAGELHNHFREDVAGELDSS